MEEQIATINEFLGRGKICLARGMDNYMILHMFDDGRAQVYKNPNYEALYTQITLTEKELANLARLCFPPEGVNNA